MERLKLEEVEEKEAAKQAAGVLSRGGVIVFPAERLYGLGASAEKSSAVDKVLGLKNRPKNVPLPLVAGDMEMVKKWVKIPERALQLAEKFWPGPLTLVLEPIKVVPPGILGGSGKLGIRVPGNRVAREISQVLGAPYTATSCNVSGREPGKTAGEAVAGLCGEVDLVLDGGELAGPPPSTVVLVDGESIRVIRAGAINTSTLESI